MFIFGGNAYVPQNGVRLSVVEVAYEEKVMNNIIDNVYFFLTPLYLYHAGYLFSLVLHQKWLHLSRAFCIEISEMQSIVHINDSGKKLGLLV